VWGRERSGEKWKEYDGEIFWEEVCDSIKLRPKYAGKNSYKK
jgi:hypothetical protein